MEHTAVGRELKEQFVAGGGLSIQDQFPDNDASHSTQSIAVTEKKK